MREDLAMAEALIDLDRLGRNIELVRRRLGGRARLLFTVKADAYGHGALPVAREAARAGVDWLGVASAAEALRLREVVDLPILILGLSHLHHLPQLAELGELGIALTLDSLEFARALDRAAARRGTRPRVHVKLDTGLGRIGLPAEEALPFFRELHRLRSLQIEGVFSHLSVAASPHAEDKAYTLEQIARFRRALAELARAHLLPELRHIANSAALIRYFDQVTAEPLNLVRPGILLYGYPEAEAPWTGGIRPILTVRTWIVTVRDVQPGSYLGYGRSFRSSRPMRVAVIPFGYEDGLNVELSGRGAAAVRGKRAPIIGRVSMDQTLLDVSHIPGVDVGEEVELLGENITAEELARWAGLSAVEPILTGISKRVARVPYRQERGPLPRWPEEEARERPLPQPVEVAGSPLPLAVQGLPETIR